MILRNLRKQVHVANLNLVKRGLVILTWGNVSAIDRETNLIAIKPSGVDYKDMKWEDIVIVDLDGNVVDGKLKPSSDTPTHIELYKKMPISSIVHTHSKWATVFAQAGMSIPVLGTTHADYFYGDIPCVRPITDSEISGDYEKNIGGIIAELFADKDIYSVPSALVYGHGPFSWGRNAGESVRNAVVLDYLAMMAYRTMQLNTNVKPIPQSLVNKHFMRKHGPNRYYGQ